MSQAGNDTFVFHWSAGANVQANAANIGPWFEQMSPAAGGNQSAPVLGYVLPPSPNDTQDAGIGPDHYGATAANFHLIDLHASHFMIGG